MRKYRVCYISFAESTPKNGSRIVRANSEREAMDVLESAHPEFSTTFAKAV